MFERFKTPMLISAIAISLMALVGTDATARCRVVSGKLRCTGPCADTSLRGVGNPVQNPVAVCAVLHIDTVTGQCWNKPENATKAKGTVFSPHVSISGSGLVEACHLTDERGSAEVPICWSWEEIVSGVQEWIDENIQGCSSGVCYPYCKGTGICPNPNWWFDQCNWTIDVVYVYHSSYQWADDNQTELKSVSPLCRRCERISTDPEVGECGFFCREVKLSECTEDRELDVACWLCVNDPDCGGSICPDE